mmetsp:Transcript_25354/g.81973  ORF Transcript_25354/g.81973 Transcript_25354/m.81973 type:complete len:259 (+) Transcript_25354:1529-2305(+)
MCSLRRSRPRWRSATRRWWRSIGPASAALPWHLCFQMTSPSCYGRGCSGGCRAGTCSVSAPRPTCLRPSRAPLPTRRRWRRPRRYCRSSCTRPSRPAPTCRSRWPCAAAERVPCSPRSTPSCGACGATASHSSRPPTCSPLLCRAGGCSSWSTTSPACSSTPTCRTSRTGGSPDCARRTTGRWPGACDTRGAGLRTTGRRRITAGLALSGKRCVFAPELRWPSNGARFKLLVVLPRCLGPGLWGGSVSGESSALCVVP